MKKSYRSAEYAAKIGVLTALAFCLMLLEFPLSFLAPSFYKLDLSEVPALIGSFALGPLAGVLIELLKNLLHLPLSSTAFVGELANFITGVSFVLPASLLYRQRKTRRGALLGMGVGTAVLLAVGGLLNYFFLIPFFCEFYGMPCEAVVEMGRAIYPVIDDLGGVVTLCVLPFNLLKGLCVSVLTYFLYKRVSWLLHLQKSK